MSAEFRHRPTLKQSNKSFKSKHRSKGDLKRASKGKVEDPTGAPRPSVRQLGKGDEKQNRRNLAKQIQGNKRAEVLQKQRKGRADDGAPRLIVRIAFSSAAHEPIVTSHYFLGPLCNVIYFLCLRLSLIQL